MFVTDTVRVYDYVSKTPMCQAKYNSGGSSLLWIPKEVRRMRLTTKLLQEFCAFYRVSRLLEWNSFLDQQILFFQVESSGTKLLAGFNDGVVRLLALNKVDPSQLRSKKSKLKYELNLEQVFKPHTKSLNVLTIDEQGELLATGVSFLSVAVAQWTCFILFVECWTSSYVLATELRMSHSSFSCFRVMIVPCFSSVLVRLTNQLVLLKLLLQLSQWNGRKNWR